MVLIQIIMQIDLIFYNGTVILPDLLLDDGVVLCAEGKISNIGRYDDITLPESVIRVDAKGGYISPGFVDIHVHGGGGADFMDGSSEAVKTAIKTHTRHGTTTIFPTTTTGSSIQIEQMLQSCSHAKKSWTNASDGARIGGVHFYGPYFAENMVGAHPKGHSRFPDPDEYLRFFDMDIIRIATCAAELPGAEDYYMESSRRGYLVTCGHSDATWQEMERGFKAGLRHVDHFWCAMSSIESIRERFKGIEQPMQGSMEQFVLMYESMSTEVLADGCHLSPELLDFAFHMKGPKRLCLVTDSNRALGMPPGEYRIGPKTDGELFISNGRVGYQTPGYRLASTVVGMEVMVRNMNAMTSANLCDTIRMASLTPSECVGMADVIGSLEVGKHADVLILDKNLTVQRVFIEGHEFVSTS